MNVRRIFFLNLLLFFASNMLVCESFRVSKVSPVYITGQVQAEQTLSIGINEAVPIFLPEEKIYLESIEVKISIPNEIISWQDSVALSIYDNIRPRPSTAQIDYNGNRSFVRPLPARSSWILRIPLTNANLLKESAYETRLQEIPDIRSNFIFLRFQLAMKGVPDEVFSAIIALSVKPILANKGKLALETVFPLGEKSEFNLFIDGNKVDSLLGEYILSAGTHDIHISSENYRGETRSVRINTAKTTDLRVELRSISPALIIVAPDNAQVYLDNVRCKQIGKEFTVNEGNHSLKFVMGDYELIRNISFVKGKTYTVSLDVSLKIDEQ